MKYTLFSPLTVDDCIDRLHKELDKPVELFSTQRPPPLIGRVQDHRFMIRVNHYRNHLAFYGTLAASTGGTTIEGDYRVRTFVKVFLAIWTASGTFLFCGLGLAVTVGIAMLYVRYSDPGSAIEELRGITVNGLFFTAVLGFGGSIFWVLFGIGMFLLVKLRARFARGKEELGRILVLLENTLEARRIEQDQAI